MSAIQSRAMIAVILASAIGGCSGRDTEMSENVMAAQVAAQRAEDAQKAAEEAARVATGNARQAQPAEAEPAADALADASEVEPPESLQPDQEPTEPAAESTPADPPA